MYRTCRLFTLRANLLLNTSICLTILGLATVLSGLVVVASSNAAAAATAGLSTLLASLMGVDFSVCEL